MHISKRVRGQFKWQRPRARKYGVINTLTLEEWVTILQQAKGACAYCKRQVGEQFLCLEHIVSMCNGGANSAENITAACFRCNSVKKDRNPESLIGIQSYPLIERTPEHYDIKDLARANRSCGNVINAQIRKGKIRPIGICASNGRSLLFNQETYDEIKGNRKFWDTFGSRSSTEI